MGTVTFHVEGADRADLLRAARDEYERYLGHQPIPAPVYYQCMDAFPARDGSDGWEATVTLPA